MNTLLIIEAPGYLNKGADEKRKLPVPPSIDQKATAQRIKDYMNRLELKPADVQRYLELTCVQTVYRWFDGTNIPTIDHLYALSRLFGVKVDDMIIAVKDDTVKNREYRNLSWLLKYCKNWVIHREGN